MTRRCPTTTYQKTSQACSTRKSFFCDITATLDFFLALAERAGRCPKEIWNESDEERIGLTDLTSLVTRKQALLELQYLELDILSDW
jgi:hypothetical protein